MEDSDVQFMSNKSGKARYTSHQIRRRAPPRLPSSENDIFVNNSTNLQCQVAKCHKLFQEGRSEIVIHGLGAAINTAVNVALILQEKLSHTVDLAVNTSTVEIIDDYQPLCDNEEPFSKSRSNSAIHLKGKQEWDGCHVLHSEGGYKLFGTFNF